VALQILQQARNDTGLYFINTMHVLLETDTPKHLLIVGPFDASDAEQSALGEGVRTQMMAFGFDVMMFYYLKLE
jgi:hypothetical protein